MMNKRKQLINKIEETKKQADKKIAEFKKQLLNIDSENMKNVGKLVLDLSLLVFAGLPPSAKLNAI